jgi:hypothetical protein
VSKLAERVGIAFGRKLRDCDTLDPAIARALAWVLRDFEDAGTRPGLEAGLQCKSRPAVRYLCAQAFVDLKENAEADPLLREQVLRTLRDAGQAETSGLVMQRIYRAMAFREPDQFADATAAILDVMAARLDRRKALAGGPICDGGEQPVLALFAAQRPPSESLRVRLVNLLAILLRLDVQRMTQEGIAELERNRLVQEIDACEKLLLAFVSPSNPTPKIRAAMRKGDDVRSVEMMIELNNWIGAEGSPGALNAAPWNVPVGAP